MSRLLRSYASASLEDVVLWHERDISHSSVERVALPDATILADFMLKRATRLVANLVVNEDRMTANLEQTGGLFFSEAVLLALVRSGLPRQRAYEIVQKCALSAHAGNGSFRDLLSKDGEISSRMSEQELDDCFSLKHHLRHVDHIFERTFGDTKNG